MQTSSEVPQNPELVETLIILLLLILRKETRGS